MPILNTNSHLTTKPYNFDNKCQSNSESYDQHGFFGTKFRGGQNCLLTVGGFFNEREYSGADWLVPLLSIFPNISHTLVDIWSKVGFGQCKYIHSVLPAINFYYCINSPNNQIPPSRDIMLV